MRPSKLCELKAILALFERANEEDKACIGSQNGSVDRRSMPFAREEGQLTNYIEYEADEAMMGCKYEKNSINKDYMLEVVYHTFSI